jgi:hypothetical protein
MKMRMRRVVVVVLVMDTAVLHTTTPCAEHQESQVQLCWQAQRQPHVTAARAAIQAHHHHMHAQQPPAP